MKIKVNNYLAEFLKVQEIGYVFEVAGGMITHLLDAIYQLGHTHIVSMHHEQATAFASEAYGRITGKPGFAFATSGPGATNLLTGIASCYFDSSPAVFITGQVNLHEQKGQRPIRQLGFQETDIISMVMPIVKKCFAVTEAEHFPQILKEAYQIAINGRPGPVLIDLPMNIQSQWIEFESIDVINRKPINHLISFELANKLKILSESIFNAKRPLILAGGGIRCANAKEEFAKFVNITGIPVVSSLMGLDALSKSDIPKLGMIGSYGNRWSNLAFEFADLIIVIGSRLDIRQTGANVEAFSHAKVIIHLDCDEAEINNRVKNCIPIVEDIKIFLEKLNNDIDWQNIPEFLEWDKKLQQLKEQWPDTSELRDCQGINPNILMHSLSKYSKNSSGYVVDVGNHQMWAAQSIVLHKGQFFMTTGGMGAMGFALPAAIGASLTLGKKSIVVIVGDGAMQMNIQELQTIVRNKLPIKILVLNNNALGMIRQFQDSYFESRYQSTYLGYSAPNFHELAKAYGIQSKTVFTSQEIENGLKWINDINDEPVLLQVMIDYKTNVYPKIAFGKPIYEMEPFAQPISMEST
jgi:acetolactate synthase-1/2/3 large subunit